MKLFIIDGYSIIYRSYFAHINNPMRNREGENISAYYGFFASLLHIISNYQVDGLAVAMDEKGPTFRHLMYPEYKATRDKAPEDLHAQVPKIKGTLGKAGIEIVSREGYEADDMIASLVRKTRESGGEAVIVTPDKDLMQLVGDGVSVLRPVSGTARKEGGYVMMGEKEVVETFGVKPSQILDYLTILGDKADNVPGIKGLGEKTAVTLLAEYITLDGVYRHLEVLSPGVRKKLQNGKEDAELSRKLIALRDDGLDGADGIERYSMDNIDLSKAVPDFEDNNCSSLSRRVLGKAFSSPKQGSEVSCIVLRSAEEAKRVLSGAAAAAIAIEGDALAFSVSEGAGYYLALPLGEAFSLFRGLKVAGHDLKALLKASWESGSDLPDTSMDTMIASWLLKSEDSSYSLERMADQYLRVELEKLSDALGDAEKLSDLPEEKAAGYLARRAEAVLALSKKLTSLLHERSLYELYRDMEHPLIRILAKMEMAGIYLSSEKMAELDRSVEQKVKELEGDIYALSGEVFNINSPKKLSEILFDKLKLTPGKKNSNGYAVDTPTLEGLREEGGEIITKLLSYRQYAKLKSTYTAPLQELRGPDGRVRTTFLQTGTATGRLSSRNPNLQNIPIRTDEGRLIRSTFLPAPGSVFLSADYSQIELCVLAHVSGDENLQDAFRSGHDIHRYTASLIFGKDVMAVTDHERRVAKTINFGIMYGMSAFRLANDLGISRKEASDFITKYFERYSGVKAFIERTESAAHETMKVTTLFGHERELPAINSSNHVERAGAERIAVNTIIQGTAAELMKIAMIAIDKELEERKLSSRMLLQVHDELIFEVPLEEKDEMAALVKEKMEGAVEFSIPVRASIEFGASWGDMH